MDVSNGKALDFDDYSITKYQEIVFWITMAEWSKLNSLVSATDLVFI
jgi:hypothetical protein